MTPEEIRAGRAAQTAALRARDVAFAESRATAEAAAAAAAYVREEEPYTGLEDVIVQGVRQSPTEAIDTDMRVRLRAQPNQANAIYGEPAADNILSILHQTGGMLFPFTPTISVEQSVDYKSIELVHSNGDINAYSRTPSVTLNVTGRFTVQNQREGEYLIAVLHFLRTVSKMHFGDSDPNAGLPPPVLYFHGYGPYMFNGLKVVLKSHSFSLDDTVDYVNVKTDGGSVTTRVPSMLTISLSLGVQNTPYQMKSVFNLEDFRTGHMMRNVKGWI
jgi:hypothetical protein